MMVTSRSPPAILGLIPRRTQPDVRILPPSSGSPASPSQTARRANHQISVQPRSEKYFASPFGRNSFMDSNRPTPQRGVSRSSRTRGGMRWTRQRFARDGIAGRVERLVIDQRAGGREML